MEKILARISKTPRWLTTPPVLFKSHHYCMLISFSNSLFLFLLHIAAGVRQKQLFHPIKMFTFSFEPFSIHFCLFLLTPVAFFSNLTPFSSVSQLFSLSLARADVFGLLIFHFSVFLLGKRTTEEIALKHIVTLKRFKWITFS